VSEEESDVFNCLRLLNDAADAIYCLVPDRVDDKLVWQIWRFDEGVNISEQPTPMKAILAAHRKLLEATK